MKRIFSLQPRLHGDGELLRFQWQRKQGNFLATCGTNNLVHIFDRQGELLTDIRLNGNCTGMEWDRDGEILAVIQEKSSSVHLWDSLTRKASTLESGMKDLTFLAWSEAGPQLAIGTIKGNLLLYNRKTSKKVPLIGKHTKGIYSGCWSGARGMAGDTLLALGSADKSLTLSNQDGESVFQSKGLRDVPRQLAFSPNGNIVSMIMGKGDTLMLFRLDNPDNPDEMAFEERYGLIVRAEWYDQTKLLLGFNKGYIVAISAEKTRIGQELFLAHNFQDELVDIAVCISAGKVATAGDNSIKIHNLSNLQDTLSIITLDDDRNDLSHVRWSDNGQLLAISTKSGAIYTYLMHLPMLGSAHRTRVAYLTSLLELTIQDNINKEPHMNIDVAVEPNFIGIGPYHVACGMNNRAWFYILGNHTSGGGSELVHEQEYLGTVLRISLNADYAAVLIEGRLHLHMIESDTSVNDGGACGRDSKVFPARDSSGSITDGALTNEFCIYSTDAGGIYYFYLEDWAQVTEYRHIVGIKSLFSHHSGTSLVFIDDKNDGFIYVPVNDALIGIDDFPSNAVGVLWENMERTSFVVYDSEKLYTYFYHPDITNGSPCKFLGSTKLPQGYKPLMLYDGLVSCQTQSGKSADILLSSHSPILPISKLTTSASRFDALNAALSLGRLMEAWPIAQKINKADTWRDVAKNALRLLSVDVAMRAYGQAKDVDLVLSLQRIRLIEDKNLLAGHIATFFDEHNKAQDLFLASSNPIAALDMRRDLLHWDQALKLSKSLAPAQLPPILLEYAQQLEFKAEYAKALIMYEKGLSKSKDKPDSAHVKACSGGIARMAIRQGDIGRGVRLALESHSKPLCRDCAAILESMKQYKEAAHLYEKGQHYDKAASIYIQAKNFHKVGELLPLVTSTRIHQQYGKAREAEGKYEEAVRAYQSAKDFDSVIRVMLDHLKATDEAVRIVKETESVEGAKLVAKFFKNIGDYESAVEFLVLSRCFSEAFDMAKEHEAMEHYASLMGNDSSVEEYTAIAYYFESKSQHLLAGQFFLRSSNYSKALKHFLLAPIEHGEGIDQAIITVGRAKNDKLTHQLIDFLMGDTDGSPKDAKYIFRLYMSLDLYREAARTAIIIAREEQMLGNYRKAHDVLFTMYRELQAQNIRIPNEMSQNLNVLHSYILCKSLVKRGDHEKGARMLIRVANNISKFPAHIVPILTSTVIECIRAGLKQSGFSYAAMLMRPEYRHKIDEKYKRKIEQIVRKPDKSEEEEDVSPCPYCDVPVASTRLDCPECKNALPYCIATGQHMVKDDWTNCPSCTFPALYSEFKRLIESNNSCIMCNATFPSNNIIMIRNPKPQLKSFSAQFAGKPQVETKSNDEDDDESEA